LATLRRIELNWDPLDESLKDDPHPVWRRMRDEAPLYRNDRYDFWALSRFDDVDSVSRDPQTFSSAHGTVLEMMSDEAWQQPMMIFLDPPEHTRLRRLVSRAFSPRRISELEAFVRQLCGSLLDAQRGREEWDFVTQFGALVPANVIATILGVPADEREEVRHTIDETFYFEPGKGMINDVSFAAQLRLAEILSQQLDERRRRPRDDMLTDLVESEITEDDGTARRLTEDEACAFGILLVSAGTETVARLIGWAGSTLADYPDQRAELANDPSLIPGAVEELLRFEAPSPVQGRWVTKPTQLYGQPLERGSKVLLLTGSAGRDERRFTDPDRFDIHRQMDHHLSFGYGIHFCLGAALARLEGRIAIEETLKRFPTWQVDRERAVMLYTSTVRGYAELPVRI
jgi:cytochrome P450